MTEPLICPAPAKLNLFLHITGRRADGYHLLQTVFQFIDLCDTLEFHPRADGEIHCPALEEVAPADNLVVRAARLLQQHSGTRQGVAIKIAKQIPVGGGLGGGSSNAATALLALNRLWHLDLSVDTLAQLGLQLGADVPVFVRGCAAWAEGVGEQLTCLDNLPEPWYLVVHPDCHVATGEIFSDPELPRAMEPVVAEDFRAGRTGNACEAVVTRLYPMIRHALAWLGNYGEARLTGTGACIFAAFPDPILACQVLDALPDDDWRGWVVKGLNRSPLQDALM